MDSASEDTDQDEVMSRTETEEKVNAFAERDRSDVMKYASMLVQEGYTDYSAKKDATIGTPGDIPYVIPPEEFGEMEGYNKYSLTYYADHILTDDTDCVIDDVDSLIGFESLTHFGEYEDDSVFVRNDRTRSDYEILRSLRTYSEVIAEKPYKAEV